MFVPYTYIGVIYAPATGGSGVALALLMLVGGIAGAIGNLAAGFLTDRLGGARVVAVALIWLTAGLLVVPLATGHFGAALVAVGFYVVGAFAMSGLVGAAGIELLGSRYVSLLAAALALLAMGASFCAQRLIRSNARGWEYPAAQRRSGR
ncbi:hypothetical protein SAMN05421630_104475 [Prauserella marina]|uniref:Uncharacterized protein n=1 Tax=Prauserella marina TaxID=530584 RepID=A0A1G6QJM0_9PSEU|nr:hypothetical protein DES30_104476 [Prauserella marina]SDC92523.1 hypothetical protein SAMN05421630_104475 [Prauserella marina]